MAGEQETIVAISTPVGRGGIGVVRVSGARAREVVEPMVRLRREWSAGRARFGEVMDLATGGVLDEAVVTYFAGPNSYTGEDVVEIAIHGSPVLLEHVVRQCCAAGGDGSVKARLAQPGEFTQRAFLAGRIDLTQAEAVDDLIGSVTLEQARVAARQLGGALARAVAPLKEELVALIAAMEAGIDFAEDDIDVMPADAIREKVQRVREPLVALERSFAAGRVVREGFTLALVGRPNAGKSSLFNRLVERERAIVTAVAGTTRDTVAERVSLGGIPVELVDTAGLREVEGLDAAERMGISRSREAMAEADVVLLVVDAEVGIAAEDQAVLDELAATGGRAALLVWNKTDLVEHDARQDISPGVPVVRTSAVTGDGIGELRAAIVEAVGAGGVREGGMLTNLRQHQAVQQALLGLAAAELAVACGTPHEVVLLDLYEALSGLDSLTGVTTSDDVLGLIFSKFCIGK